VTFEANPFAVLFDAWVLQAVVASRYLAGLYRSLKDEQQATAALWAGQPATERMERHGLQTQLLESIQAFGLEHPKRDRCRGRGLAEPHRGAGWSVPLLCRPDLKVRESVPGIQGQSTAANKAFSRALTSYLAAFPDEMVAEGIEHAFLEASRRGAEALSLAARDLTDEDRACLRRTPRPSSSRSCRSRRPSSWCAKLRL